ncbi:hypothetical protein F2P81_015603 [Scophthalmus maximus]|uniref:Uncharacterized protein n=1 Tax=Scophthalmus maximus TaxID=52904 RepID=A0A6A4SFP2_SCOMX|nr:hypothetical protein F2P81_015603 [Scophthalmus maximus]
MNRRRSDTRSFSFPTVGSLPCCGHINGITKAKVNSYLPSCPLIVAAFYQCLQLCIVCAQYNDTYFDSVIMENVCRRSFDLNRLGSICDSIWKQMITLILHNNKSTEDFIAPNRRERQAKRNGERLIITHDDNSLTPRRNVDSEATGACCGGGGDFSECLMNGSSIKQERIASSTGSDGVTFSKSTQVDFQIILSSIATTLCIMDANEVELPSLPVGKADMIICMNRRSHLHPFVMCQDVHTVFSISSTSVCEQALWRVHKQVMPGSVRFTVLYNFYYNGYRQGHTLLGCGDVAGAITLIDMFDIITAMNPSVSTASNGLPLGRPGVNLRRK